MKTKITSALFCLLISSTLGHDYHRAHRFSQENRRSHHLSHFQGRAAESPEQCQWICEGGEGGSNGIKGGLKLVANETTQLLGVVNVTAKVALVLDLNANLVGLFNGSSGAIIILNLETKTGVYMKPDECNSGWLASRESFVDYFRHLKSLQVFLDLKVGTSFSESSCPSSILQVVANILVHLSPVIGLELDGTLKGVLSILLNLSQTLSSVLKGPLKGLLGLVGNVVIPLGGDLLWLVNVLEGLGKIISEIRGGLSALIELKVELDLTLLLGSTDGVELLVNLLLAIVTRIDLSVLGNILNSLENLLSIIVKLGGNVSTGLTGVLKVVSNILALINNSISIDELIEVLTEVVASGSLDVDISTSVEALGSVIRIQGSLHPSSNLSGFISIVEQLRNDSVVVGKINVSEIIKILVTGAANGIELIVDILVKLSAIEDLAIIELIVNLITHLNITLGVHLVESLIPGLTIKVGSSGGIDLKALIEGIPIAKITKDLISGDIDGLLKSIPVIKDIYEAVSSAVSKGTNGSINLHKLLTSSGARHLVVRIIEWIAKELDISIPGHHTSEGTGTVVTHSWHIF